MKLRTTITSALAVALLAAVGVRAQEIDGYNPAGFNTGYADGDLVLAFFSSSDQTSSTASGDLLFNLGSSTNFTGLSAGTYSVAAFNGSSSNPSQGTPGFGSADVTSSPGLLSSTAYWTVMGANSGLSGGTGTNELWLTGSGAAQTQGSSSSQQQVAGEINTAASDANGNTNADGTGYDHNQTTGNYLIKTGTWPTTTTIADATVKTTSGLNDQLGLYALNPGTNGGGSSTYLGYFTLSNNGGAYSLSFTVPGAAIPEPSTYAMILGALTIGFVMVRRRFRPAGLAALA